MPSWTTHPEGPCQRFAHPDRRLEFVGTARREAQIGALALGSDGEFVLVNREQRAALNPHQILRSLRKAPGCGAHPLRPQRLPQRPPRPPPSRSRDAAALCLHHHGPQHFRVPKTSACPIPRQYQETRRNPGPETSPPMRPSCTPRPWY